MLTNITIKEFNKIINKDYVFYIENMDQIWCGTPIKFSNLQHKFLLIYGFTFNYINLGKL